jgi:phosphoribosylformylglycinamidine synthase
VRRDPLPDIDPGTIPVRNPIDALRWLMATHDLASKRWVWEQYDHLVQGNTVQRPGGDAAVVRLPDSPKALALSVDCTPRYCRADPERGGMQAVAESWRNLTATGALPIAITDNMNFGNPQKPEIMGEFAGAALGMAAACAALDYPVVSGNVSLYNETSGSAILPTPVIGGVGLLADATHAVDIAFKTEGSTLILIGETRGHLGASLYLREIDGREAGAPPPVDLAAERKHGDFVRAQIAAGRVAACHDISDGGLLVAVAEMAMAGGVGATLDGVPGDMLEHAWCFGEDQGRYLIETADPAALLAEARNESIYSYAIGMIGGDALTLPGAGAISLAELKAANEAWLPEYMSG